MQLSRQYSPHIWAIEVYKRRKTIPFAYVIAVVCALPTIALADSEDTLNLSVGAGVRFEDNLFRLSDDVDASSLAGKPHKSDSIYSANAGIKIDKPYAQQRFKLDLTVTDNKFQQNSFLDYTGTNYSAAWLWQLTPHVSGTLLMDQQQSMVNFADFRSFGKPNIQTSQVKLFSIDGDLGAGWHAIGALMDVRARNSQTFNAVGDYVQQSVELGGKYVSPSESWISLVRRESQGEYRGRALDPVTQLDTGFEQSETEAKMNWKITGKSTIDTKLGYLDRTHDHFSERDYNGMVGKVEYQWAATGKLQLNASLGRNLFSFQEAINSYYVADTLSLGPIWKISDKSKLWLKYDISERDYHGAIVATPELRQDTVHSILLGAEWRPTRTITVGAALQRDTRLSNLDRFDYDANSANIFAQMLF